jgi:hypothetical protein
MNPNPDREGGDPDPGGLGVPSLTVGVRYYARNFPIRSRAAIPSAAQ